MEPQTLYQELSGQRLVSILVREAWGRGLPPAHPQARWTLYGSVALAFERHTLIVTSPLRGLRSPHGTRVGLAGGNSVSLGFRALLSESLQADELLALGLLQTEGSWSWFSVQLPIVGFVLLGAPWLPEILPNQVAPLMMTFETGEQFRIEYRADMDGAIELSMDGSRHDLDVIEVTGTEGPWGWLHPRRIAGFVLDDLHWRNAEQWPIAVHRKLREADPGGIEVRLLLKRAWLAYFCQHPDMQRRLLALTQDARVVGVPAGLIEEVRAEIVRARAI